MRNLMMTEKVMLELIKALPSIIAAIGAVVSVLVGVSNSLKLRGAKQDIADTRTVVDLVHTLTNNSHLQMEEHIRILQAHVLNLTDRLARSEQKGQSAVEAQAKPS